MQEPVYVLHLISCHGRIMPRLAELLFVCTFWLIIPSHTIVVGYYGFMLDIPVSVRLSVVHPFIHFRMITWVNINGFPPNLICALILWRSGLGLLMGKFRQIWKAFSALDTPIFSFLDDNFKHQWIFTKLGMYNDIVKIWFGIANGQISSNFDGVICPRHTHIFISGQKLE